MSPRIPRDDPNAGRYEGRPLLLILESYLLECIGCLPAHQDARIQEIVQKVFGGGLDWKATVRKHLGLDKSVDAEFREMWEHNKRITFEAGTVLEPGRFARMVVDENFLPLIESLEK